MKPFISRNNSPRFWIKAFDSGFYLQLITCCSWRKGTIKPHLPQTRYSKLEISSNFHLSSRLTTYDSFSRLQSLMTSCPESRVLLSEFECPPTALKLFLNFFAVLHTREKLKRFSLSLFWLKGWRKCNLLFLESLGNYSFHLQATFFLDENEMFRLLAFWRQGNINFQISFRCFFTPERLEVSFKLANVVYFSFSWALCGWSFFSRNIFTFFFLINELFFMACIWDPISRRPK